MVNTDTKSGKAAFAAALGAVVIGVLALVGWILQVDALKSVLHGTGTMNPAVALAMILAGTSIGISLLAQHPRKQNSRVLLVLTARVLGLVVALIGFLRLTAILLGWDAGVDQWMFPAQVSSQYPFPSHIAPNAALNLLLVGLAILVVDVQTPSVRLCSEVSVIVVVVGALLAVLGYAYGVQSFYRIGLFIPMALNTGVAFLMLSIAFFLSHTDDGLLSIFAGDSAGGKMARRLMLAVVLLPALFGWLELRGESDGIYSGEVGNAILIMAIILVFAFLVSWSAKALFRADVERNKSEEALRLLNSAVLQSKESILITDAELDLPGPKIIFANPAFTSMTGYTVNEALGKTPRILQGPLTDKSVLKRVRENLERGEVFEGEAINYRKDGTKFDLQWQVTPLRDAGEKITHFVAIQRDITERKRAEARFRLLVESNVQGVIFWKKDGQITGANDAFLHLVRHSREDLEAGRIDWMGLTPPEYAHLDERCLAEIAATGVGTPYEKEYVLKDGSHVPILLGAASFADNPDEGVCFVLDLTDRKKLEAQLFRSQKMETVGKMAGGIAHEFNSILTAILGQSEMLLADLPVDSPLIKNASEINKAASRAAVLTRQLLAYGRKQILQPKNIDLNSMLTGLDNTLRQLAGRETDVRLVPAAGLSMVKADAGQIELVIMNVVMNAAHAMPHGGKLTLETANVALDHEYVSHVPDLKAGEYVMLAITDTGIGMSRELKARVFEPFFSTKSVGQGTGLGLSTSYGIIKQSGGHISAYSEVGQGTTFKIYLPRIEPQTNSSDKPADPPGLPHGTETILLVEDDPALREMAAKLLARLGYTVLKAANGLEALSLSEQRDHESIDLLFTDVVMPHLSGKELTERILVTFPQVKVLFTSAYTENAIVHQGILDEGVALLQKPFTPTALANKLRDVLDN